MRACGLCCDGGLFRSVPLRDTDPAPSGTQTYFSADGKVPRFFTQPCPAHKPGVGCTVYDARPIACRKFSCLQLRLTRVGITGLDAPDQVIAQAVSLRHATQEAASERIDPQTVQGLSIKKLVEQCRHLPDRGDGHTAWLGRVTTAYDSYTAFVERKILTNRIAARMPASPQG